MTAGMSTIETPPLAAPVPELSILSQTAESSVIRDLLRLVAQSDVLSLACGLPAPSCLPTERIAEAALSLAQVCTPADAATAGAPYVVGLEWNTSAPLTQTLNASVQILDGRDQVIAQHDGVAGGARPSTASVGEVATLSR